MLIDSFLFNDELDLLATRLEYLDPFIDFFYLAECGTDHSGNAKPFHYLENSNRFSRYNNKIIRVEIPIDKNCIIDEKVFGLNPIASKIESRSRTYLGEAIKSDHPDSTLIYSDLDEIIDRRIFNSLKTKKMVALEHNLYYYYCNNRCVTFPYTRLPWSLIIPTSLLNENTLTHFRNVIFNLQARYLGHAINTKDDSIKTLNDKYDNEILPILEKEFNLTIMKNSGYHFSYFGGVNVVIKKLMQSSHSDIVTKEMLDQNYIFNCIKNGYDIFNRDIKFNIDDKSLIHSDLENLILNHKFNTL